MLIMTLFGLLREGLEFSVFPGLAIVLGLYFHIALLADGSITEVSGGTVTAIASASTSVTSVWQALQFVPTILTIIPFLIVVYRVSMVVMKK